MQTHAHTSHTNPPTRKKVIYISRLCVDQREMNKLENTEPGYISHREKIERVDRGNY